MKKTIIIFFAIFILLNVVSCKKDEAVSVWSFNNELEGLINNFYLKENPDFKFNYSITPFDQFTSALDPVLASGRGTPDVFALDAGFVRRYVESGLLLDLTHIYEKNKNKLLAYPIEIVTLNDRVYALSLNISPGAVIYRRSLAEKYIGTDNPSVVQAYFADINLFMQTAALLKERSNGACVITANLDDLFNVFLSVRENPWVVSGSLIIDPVMEEYMEISKTIYENRYDARAGYLSNEWFAAMNDSLFYENGNKMEVFSFFIPSHFLHDAFITGASVNSGDWAVIPGPSSYHRGGTWIGAWKDTSNPEAVKDLIEYLTCNDSFLESYALNSGVLTGSISVGNKIASTFSEPFLGGQNHYTEFFEIAKNINGTLMLGADQIINELFIEQVTSYVLGEKTKEQALADFRQNVNTQFSFD